MIILGITDSISAGAALVEDGKVLAAVSEERLNRQKMAMGFPEKSISEVLRIASLEMKDIDHVVVATDHLFWRPQAIRLEDYFRRKTGLSRDLFLASGSFFSKWTGGNQFSRRVYYELKSRFTQSRKRKIKEALAQQWGYRGELAFVDHHLAHCASAYFTSGMEQATVISLDGAGDGCSSHCYRVQNGKFTLQNKIDSYDSIGNYYAYVTHLCGFVAHKHEGKITGLAAFGGNQYVDLLRKYIRYEPGTIRNTGGCFDWSAIRKLQKDLGQDFSKEDLAASIQYLLEEIVSRHVEFWVAKLGFPNVALAGGVFANVKLNQRIHELDCVQSIFIHPGMGDEGLATGAALLKSFQACQETNTRFRPTRVSNVYWGPEYSESELAQAIRSFQYPCEHHEDIEATIASLIADGKIVARFAGRMEYGPRALGNRSILYQSTDVTVNDWLNKRLKRTEFMPFAPVTLKEHAAQCFEGMSGAEVPAEFMTITFNCTDWMKKHCPAVVHVDGTARPQTICKDTNPSYYRIVNEYRKITGLPSIVNTSFNMHEEPIVCTPNDALRAFRDGHLDYLAMGRFLIKNPELPSLSKREDEVAVGAALH